MRILSCRECVCLGIGLVRGVCMYWDVGLLTHRPVLPVLVVTTFVQLFAHKQDLILFEPM